MKDLILIFPVMLNTNRNTVDIKSINCRILYGMSEEQTLKVVYVKN